MLGWDGVGDGCGEKVVAGRLQLTYGVQIDGMVMYLMSKLQL